MSCKNTQCIYTSRWRRFPFFRKTDIKLSNFQIHFLMLLLVWTMRKLKYAIEQGYKSSSPYFKVTSRVKCEHPISKNDSSIRNQVLSEIVISFNSTVKYHTTTKSNTCHDSTAVMSCTKLASGNFTATWMTAERNCNRIWITKEKLFWNEARVSLSERRR